MSYFGVTNNNNDLLLSLIEKVDILTKIVMDDETDDLDEESMFMPKTFKQLRSIVMNLAKNDVGRIKDNNEISNIVFAQSKDINIIKRKLNIIEVINDD